MVLAVCPGSASGLRLRDCRDGCPGISYLSSGLLDLLREDDQGLTVMADSDSDFSPAESNAGLISYRGTSANQTNNHVLNIT